MAIPRFADEQFPDVRMVPQVVTRPSADPHNLISVNPSALFRPYSWRSIDRSASLPKDLRALAH